MARKPRVLAYNSKEYAARLSKMSDKELFKAWGEVRNAASRSEDYLRRIRDYQNRKDLDNMQYIDNTSDRMFQIRDRAEHTASRLSDLDLYRYIAFEQEADNRMERLYNRFNENYTASSARALRSFENKLSKFNGTKPRTDVPWRAGFKSTGGAGG